MTRNDILDAAAQIFSQKGFHAASMQDIAEAVNLQKASLYYHVSSKQEILLALLDRALDLLIEHMERVLNKPLPPNEKLREAMCVYLTVMLDNRDLASILLLEHRSLEPEMRIRHTDRRDRFESLWREIIADGAEAGLFACDNPGMAARALLGVMNWTITWYRREGPLSPEMISEQFTDLFLYGLLKRDGSLGS